MSEETQHGQAEHAHGSRSPTGTGLPAGELRHDQVWFVIFRRAVDEYRAAGRPDHPHRIWFNQHYNLVSVNSFNDLDLYEYQTGPPSAAAAPLAFHPLEAAR